MSTEKKKDNIVDCATCDRPMACSQLGVDNIKCPLKQPPELKIDAIEKIRAFYDYDVVWNEWADPEQFKRADDDRLGWIAGIKMKTEDGVQFVKNEVHGSDEAIENIIALCDEGKLQTTLAGGWEIDAIARKKEIVKLKAELKLLAMLASNKPEFDSPLVVADVIKLRDSILKGGE